jgi:hypothetical protein
MVVAMHLVLEYHPAQGAYSATVDRFDGWGASERRAITALAERLRAEVTHGGKLGELAQAAAYWPTHELADWLRATAA